LPDQAAPARRPAPGQQARRSVTDGHLAPYPRPLRPMDTARPCGALPQAPGRHIAARARSKAASVTEPRPPCSSAPALAQGRWSAATRPEGTRVKNQAQPSTAPPCEGHTLRLNITRYFAKSWAWTSTSSFQSQDRKRPTGSQKSHYV
jgi:hypothetical protein